jgi:hypothetical protein
MAGLEVLVVFGMPVVIVGVVKYFRFKTEELKLRAGSAKELEAWREERHKLEERVANLESIVCDLEMEGRLDRPLRAAADALPAGSEVPRPRLPERK